MKVPHKPNGNNGQRTYKIYMKKNKFWADKYHPTQEFCTKTSKQKVLCNILSLDASSKTKYEAKLIFPFAFLRGSKRKSLISGTCGFFPKAKADSIEY